MTASELGNAHGYQCPACKYGDELKVGATTTRMVMLLPDGVEDPGGDVEWSENSAAHCNACGWNGKVSELDEVDLEEE